MNFPLAGVIIDPQGVSTSVTITADTGATASVYSDAYGMSPVSMPQTISSRVTYYLPGEGPWTLTPTVDGAVLAGHTFTLEGSQVATVTVPVTYARSTQLGAYVPLSDVTAEGDLLVASGNAAIARLGVGVDTYVLTADSTQTLGVKWAAAGAGDVTAVQLGGFYPMDASFNMALGGTLSTLTTGTENYGLGHGTLGAVTTASGSVAIGYQAGQDITTAGSCVAIGLQALQLNTAGYNCTAVGAGAAQNNQSTYTTAFGASALGQNTTGSENCAFGADALDHNTTGTNNTACGLSALNAVSTGSYNVGIGWSTLAGGAFNATGSANTVVGAGSMGSGPTTADNNTAVGAYAMGQATTATRNVAVGSDAMQYITTGAGNVAVGWQAGYVSDAGVHGVVTGSYNTLVGYEAGSQTNTDYSNMTALGKFANPQGNGAVAIGTDNGGNGAVAAGTNYFVLGTTLHKLFIPGLPTADPHVAGQLYANGVAGVGAPVAVMVSGG